MGRDMGSKALCRLGKIGVRSGEQRGGGKELDRKFRGVNRSSPGHADVDIRGRADEAPA